MTDQISLPDDYQPFPEMILCGNVLKNVQILFRFENGAPILIGKGDVPKIWLNAFSTEGGKHWHPVVLSNESLNKEVTISGLGTGLISVKVKGMDILNIENPKSGIPNIIHLDLRPLGLDIYGEKSELLVGTHRIMRNTFENVKVMVGIGEK